LKAVTSPRKSPDGRAARGAQACRGNRPTAPAQGVAEKMLHVTAPTKPYHGV